MTTERWLDIVATVTEKFPDAQRKKEPLPDGPGSVDALEFTSPVGRVRLEFTTHPRVIGKKAFGGRRVGTATSVSYQYDPNEDVHEMIAYRQEQGEWREIDASAFFS